MGEHTDINRIAKNRKYAKLTIYLKASWLDLDFYYKTDLEGEYGNYAENIKDKVKTALALENDAEKEDIDTDFVLSVSRKNKLAGIIKAGEIEQVE